MKKLFAIIMLIIMPITANAADRTINLNGEISDGNTIADQIRKLNKESSEEITIRITSYGGSVYEGLKILDAMRVSKARIHTICAGYCMSMGAVILASGNIRQAEKDSTILVHEMSDQISGKLTYMLNEINQDVELQKKIDTILINDTGLTQAKIELLESYDHYLTPEQALEYHLIDSII